MSETGGAYIKSKDGWIRMAIIVCGIIAFALVAASGYGGPIAWPFAAYLMSWLISFISFFFILSTLSSKMECGVSYDTVDVCLSILLWSFCLFGSIVLAIYTSCHNNGCTDNEGERIAAIIFGFIATILYAVEIYFHQENAPSPTKYIVTKNGVVKCVVITLGCIAFTALVAGGYECYGPGGNQPCDSGRAYALAAYVISWSVSVILMLIYVTGLNEKIGDKMSNIDFVWSVFSCLLCFSGSVVLSCYLEGDVDSVWGSRRLASAIFGFFTTIAYIVEAVFLKANIKGDVIPK